MIPDKTAVSSIHARNKKIEFIYRLKMNQGAKNAKKTLRISCTRMNVDLLNNEREAIKPETWQMGARRVRLRLVMPTMSTI
jgi:hypothetical protein